MKNIETLGAESLAHDLLVVVFDMCSSTKLIEDLTRTGNLSVYDRFLKDFHLWISSNAKASNYVVYKFTGDGWILLFPVGTIDGKRLMNFLLKISKRYEEMRTKFIDSHLESMPETQGLTFGVEMGGLHKILFGNEVEFVGRALNVACRLQSAVKDEGHAGYRCLFSRKVYNSLLNDKALDDFNFKDVERTLRNISGGERYRCVKAELMAKVYFSSI